MGTGDKTSRFGIENDKGKGGERHVSTIQELRIKNNTKQKMNSVIEDARYTEVQRAGLGELWMFRLPQ
jgi:hypothetical protein